MMGAINTICCKCVDTICCKCVDTIYATFTNFDNCCKETLYHAIKNADTKSIDALLKREDRVDSCNYALERSARNGELAVVTKLLENGARVTAEALERSVQNGHLEIVTKLLENGAQVTAATLECGAWHGHLEIVTKVLEYGTIMNYDDSSDSDIVQMWSVAKNSALQLSAENNYLEIVIKLLECGADVHSNDNCALKISARNGNIKIVTKLLEYGADVHADDDWALLSSVQHGYLDIVIKLLEYGANVRTHNDRALLLSSRPKWTNTDLEIVARLLECDGDVCCYNKVLLKNIENRFNKGFADVIFPYCTSDDYHYFPDWFVKDNVAQTKVAIKCS